MDLNHSPAQNGIFEMRIIALLFALITGFLSQWQFQRLDWKVKLIEYMHNNYNTPPLKDLKNAHEFNRVALEGKWLLNPVFLEYKIYKGSIGCHLILPFKTNNDIILVNLRWQKSCKKIQIPIPEKAQGILKKLPTKPEGTLPNSPPNEYYYLNEIDMRNKFNLSSHFYIDTINEIPELPNNHLIYALTWLLLSLFFICIFMFLILHQRHLSKDLSHDIHLKDHK